MQYSLLLTLGLAISRSASAPTPQDAAPPESSDTTMPSNGSPAPYDWDADAVHDFRIHESCNASEQVQLRKGLQDAVALAAHARIHILRHGNSSVHYQKYFGNGAPGQIMGWYDKVIEGDRGNSLFRCDNPDGNCDIPSKSPLNSLSTYLYYPCSDLYSSMKKRANPPPLSLRRPLARRKRHP